MSKKQIYKDIFKEYEDIRHNNVLLLEYRKQEIYKKCTKIFDIDEELKKTGLDISKKILSGEKKNNLSFIKQIKDNTKKLLNEKEMLLNENGYPKNYISTIYTCKKCKDTGFIDNTNLYCDCFKQKLINKTYQISNLENILPYENFDTFDLRYYSNETDLSRGISPLENIKLVLRKCQMFVDKFDNNSQNIIFSGGAGLGKTFLCNCIAKEILDKGYLVMYSTAFKIFDVIEKDKFGKKSNMEDAEGFIQLISQADLLIIDDLGSEFVTSLSSSELFNFLNNRLLNKKPTIISTNLSPSELMKQYSSRIVSRLYGNYDIIRIFGDDIRIKKTEQKLSGR